jgi:gluconokinase
MDGNQIRAIVVMGVSGCGKSTLGAGLARRLGWAFLEGDDFHPAANRAKMAAGIALSDEDRAPWLDILGTALHAAAQRGGVVGSCSALRRCYRDRLRALVPGLAFVHLTLDRELLAARMAARAGHYMPVSLLDSQLALLEPPGADEPCLSMSAAEAPAVLLDRAAAFASA